MSMETVKRDLEEIKFYYANQTDFDLAARSIGESAVLVKIKRYTEAIVKAPAMLYGIYVALYVNGMTQFDYATDYKRSTDYVGKLHAQLCQYLSEYFGGV